MDRATKLESTVRSLYEGKNPQRADWADWLAAHHVFVVAGYASDLAKRYGANAELARLAALMHDIADVRMSRADPNHEAESLAIARQLMQDHGYEEEDIALVVDDAIRYHSCHGDERPQSLEGKVLSAADSLAHLKSDFYIYATWIMGRDGKSLPETKQWVLKKIKRDLNDKIMFDDLREEVRADYDAIERVWSR